MNLRDKFKLKVLQSNGTQYEMFFNEVMKNACHEFQSVKPHGNIGDRGNDGWIQRTGAYFQVYAPEELFKNTEAAKKKVKSDFITLKAYWEQISPIRSFFYVVNDKFQGVSPHISLVLEEIKSENNLEKTGVFSTSNLESVLFRLPQESICSLLGVSQPQVDQLYDDRKKVREFLDSMASVFDELFNLGREAGYFFPVNVFTFISEWTDSDWQFRRLLSSNENIQDHQVNMRSQLIKMHNQVRNDNYYEYIGRSFKYKPPYDLDNRNELIKSKKDSMGKFINKFAESYVVVSDYST
ncbi:hypothetical protein [Desulfobotulus mexicanus]|uniref:Uncharacterized protein n=1 Tax=Desulfobotulus mexicanus TaxID=2586642 RepID=A0A5Q4VI63_9BACT|nr:hypothetical protein [Desulfobotulus mexicanus]TYT75681.1 hypothetical protein FIM25_04380 [Desulfobotulus mexicanus]